jgi:hypothetical protein
MAEARMTISDHMYELEATLDRPGLNFLERRLALRKTLEAVRSGALREGHTEGMRDVNDARFADLEVARAAMAARKGGSGG